MLMKPSLLVDGFKGKVETMSWSSDDARSTNDVSDSATVTNVLTAASGSSKRCREFGSFCGQQQGG